VIRLNKYLAQSGVASRRKADEIIKQGRVVINNKVNKELGFQVDPSKHKIFVDGEIVKPKKFVYYLLNKPRGIITSTKDDKKRITVLDLISTSYSIFPIGRLDYNTTGVLILTNDGDLTNKLLHPSYRISREYIVTLDKSLDRSDKEKLMKGILLDERRSKFESISFPKKTNYKIVKVTTTEGRNHFVKRMFRSLGYFVNKLHRESFGGLNVVDIGIGQYRKITKKEIENCLKIT
jgi:23S rRNA pseudouridine2605 synthase